MTDEELGRAWAAKHGRKPKVSTDGTVSWFSPVFASAFELPKNDRMLSPVVTAAVRDEIAHMDYPSEAAAYADLGAALRRLQEHVRVD